MNICPDKNLIFDHPIMKIVMNSFSCHKLLPKATTNRLERYDINCCPKEPFVNPAGIGCNSCHAVKREIVPLDTSVT